MKRGMENKRVPCSNEMNRHLRTVYATVPWGYDLVSNALDWSENVRR